MVTKSKQKPALLKQALLYLAIFQDISTDLQDISSKEGVQILICFQMNKSGPLQIISKLVTSARLLMHLLWSSLPSQWWDLGHSVHREERQLAPIWALLSSLNTKHILKSKQKKNATASLFVFAQLLCIEICQSSPLQHATQARTLITSHALRKET